MSDLARNLAQIENNIKTTCQKLGRDPATIKVLLATKGVTPKRIHEAATLGYTLCGENKAQELSEKLSALHGIPLHWHFIGHLQTNKVKDVVEHCEVIHSVDRLSLAQEISKRALLKNKVCRILVEVNTSGEEVKSGVDLKGAVHLCEEITKLDGVFIEGLMTVAQESSDPKIVRGCFKKLKDLAQEIKNSGMKNIKMKELSMGMSGDYMIALEEGATLLRLGSAAFGQRPV